MRSPFLVILICATGQLTAQTNTFPSNGNVGIGTLDPGRAALNITRLNNDGGATNAPFIHVLNTNASDPNGTSLNLAWADFIAGNGQVVGQIVSNYGVGSMAPFNSGSGVYITSRTDHPIIFVTGATPTEKVRIATNGNVGIGISSPIRPLTVNGIVHSYNASDLVGYGGFSLGNENGHYWGLRRTATGSHLAIDAWNGSNNVEYMRILSNNGNVGIGIANPTAKLTVNGQNPVLRLVNSGGRTPGNSITCEFAIDGEAQSSLGGFSFINTTGQPAAHDYRIFMWDGVGAVPERFRIQGTTGNIGIGTSAPTARLDVIGTVKATGFTFPANAGAGKVLTSDANGNASWQTAGSSSGWALNGNTVSSDQFIGSVNNAGFKIITNNTERLRIQADGKVAIGAPSNLPATDAMLSVNGNIYSRKVKVTVSGWADYVFNDNYRLRPLSELAQYIQQNHHLPEVPSSAEVNKNGLDVGDNQVVLLKKIEELTLYAIEQNKQLQEQAVKLLQMQEEINELKKSKTP